MSWPGGGTHLQMCAAASLLAACPRACLSLCCGVGSLVRTPVVSIRFVRLRARLNLHAAKDNFPDMTATWNSQAYVEDAKRDAVARGSSMFRYCLLLLSRLRVGQMDMQMAGLRG